jgi:hypothetical protein
MESKRILMTSKNTNSFTGVNFENILLPLHEPYIFQHNIIINDVMHWLCANYARARTDDVLYRLYVGNLWDGQLLGNQPWGCAADAISGPLHMSLSGCWTWVKIFYIQNFAEIGASLAEPLCEQL